MKVAPALLGKLDHSPLGLESDAPCLVGKRAEAKCSFVGRSSPVSPVALEAALLDASKGFCAVAARGITKPGAVMLKEVAALVGLTNALPKGLSPGGGMLGGGKGGEPVRSARSAPVLSRSKQRMIAALT